MTGFVIFALIMIGFLLGFTTASILWRVIKDNNG
jgi:hypothetical protein